ncbi:hypothetical protein L6452_22626 [Arctium lappa]|uniref:Uncharacterized protein n=1 Tax=Arctium lappa TaxID=4217 RepID=A0ACB9B0F0_ARCLA|nr:hypothetical protein L6452_22626 [Arctium lappa]
MELGDAQREYAVALLPSIAIIEPLYHTLCFTKPNQTKPHLTSPHPLHSFTRPTEQTPKFVVTCYPPDSGFRSSVYDGRTLLLGRFQSSYFFTSR